MSRWQIASSLTLTVADRTKHNYWKKVFSVCSKQYNKNNKEIQEIRLNVFTQKNKLSVFGMVDKCKEMVCYYSKEQDRKFSINPKLLTQTLKKKKLKTLTNLFIPSMVLIK